ncbi:tRNA (N6-threonylcarbamoyladenosine(37)-N6)-methyltransferase TrmO [Marinobacterium jannaschii]|uniref:tRNA (N6-threonylcarbamoyladenosine(37)-N6)-methyltransferase TrmO n=1 Tax=Marinobacterium jannaschii TaxID=64970 RepID=UPI00048196C2|nr:tRNA (N6-threonylcarbamoyladenosine(37)-N6)-methyltransferase TrmO [Marinobacterium jannaschii]
MTDSLTLSPIAVVRSAYVQKFGIPHQPGMTGSLRSFIEFMPDIASAEAVRGLEQCSHIWLVFVFSATMDEGWKPTVRPPRMGGKTRLGVFATRTPHRPNPIGLSPVKLEAVHTSGGKVTLEVSGADLLDGTPILDIKPYLPGSDCLPEAHYPLASSREKLDYPVVFSEQADIELKAWQKQHGQPIHDQIAEVLLCDPRPGYARENNDREYGINLYDLNIRWQVANEQVRVVSVETDWVEPD